MSAIGRNSKRNAFIVKRVVDMYQSGRVIMLLSDRNAQLEVLHTMLCKCIPEEDVGVFVGKTKEADRNTQLARKVVLSNYPMANEGLSKDTSHWFA